MRLVSCRPDGLPRATCASEVQPEPTPGAAGPPPHDPPTPGQVEQVPVHGQQAPSSPLLNPSVFGASPAEATTPCSGCGWEYLVLDQPAAPRPSAHEALQRGLPVWAALYATTFERSRDHATADQEAWRGYLKLCELALKHASRPCGPVQPSPFVHLVAGPP